jgi:hypothetical protein
VIFGLIEVLEALVASRVVPKLLAAIPGAGYQVLDAGMPVRFELVESVTGHSARNVQHTDS